MRNRIINFLDLHNDEAEKEKVLEGVTANVSFRGANLWILACAIIVASVGLNVNSTAVIIGAMLISPLMGPIVGAGFALGTFNFLLLKKSFKNLAIATVVSLLVSYTYFALSPFKDAQSELLARTSPTIYDVLIAFFGGLVGAIAATRKEKGNPIPGVAIATALMPPLCTAGYGLSTGNWSFFFGAFYLYTINCFFICIATFLMVKYLKYPALSNVASKYQRALRYGITTLVVVMIVPSFYLAYQLLQQRRFEENVNKFVTTEFTNQGYTVIYQKLTSTSSPKKIELAFLSKKVDSARLGQLNNLLPLFGLSDAQLVIRQDATDLKSEILSEIGKQSKLVSEKDLIINDLRQQLSQYQIDSKSLTEEIGILFPEVKSVTVGMAEQIMSTDTTARSELARQLVFIYQASKPIDETKFTAWLQNKMGKVAVRVIRE